MILLIKPLTADTDDDSPSPSIYKADDHIVLDCGFTGGSFLSGGDRRYRVGHVDSAFLPSKLQSNNDSVTSQSSSINSTAPYQTARLSWSEFTYLFPVSTLGPKFIRLYFYAASYPNFDRFKAVFSVVTGPYTLLRDFNASLVSDASNSTEIFREFCVLVEGVDQNHSITFTPSSQDTYAFISGIEIVSMPTYLYYTPLPPNNEFGQGMTFVGQDNRLKYTALETVYRINIGGPLISSSRDTGMFRTWSLESINYLYDIREDARPVNTTITLNFSKEPEYTAPQDLYRTARTMGPNATINRSYNLTWKYPVDPGFFYMLRLHFCEFEGPINYPGDRVFEIYIHDSIAEESADVIRWTGGKGIPYYRDYVVLVSNSNDEKKVDLSVKLQANSDEWTRWSSVILNGIEIFKLNDSNGNLAVKNPTTIESVLQLKSNARKMMIIVYIVVGGVVFFIIVAISFHLFVFRRARKYNSREGTSRRAIFSFRIAKSKKTHNTNRLSYDLCRYFSLIEIKAATNNFDNTFIIGVGGFGNVYNGYIDNGTTQVAIKRLKPDSKQGAREFKTEIEMLSQLRHLHLVSLIGYCDDGNEMIIVYDYMSRGTLRSHLYDHGQEPSLRWKQRLQICIGAARGLQYLHSGTKYVIIHRDVKTTNVLLDEKWVAKVSDFGLSKVGSIDMSKTHVTTEVKGSFGYLDPEYYRYQRLTEKSDVYAFGVVLCEALCGRSAVISSEDMRQNNLANWVRWCNSQNMMAQIIDKSIEPEIAPECLKKFIEIAVSCIEDEGSQRPSMDDVVWGLKIALQLQNTFEGVAEECMSTRDVFDENVSNLETNGQGSNFADNKGFSNFFHTEIMELRDGR